MTAYDRMSWRVPYMHRCSVCKCQWGTLAAIRLHQCEHVGCADWHVELMPVEGPTWMDRELLGEILGASR